MLAAVATSGCWPWTIRTAAVAAPSYPVRPGETVINIGCNNGAEPTVRTSRVTSLDKFLGPPNIQVAGQPVQGPWPPHQEPRPDPDYESLPVAVPDPHSFPREQRQAPEPGSGS